MPLSSVITARGDTFRIRSYGETRDMNGRLEATAICEATVQRLPEYIDPGDPAYAEPGLLNEVNRAFGRRFAITSLRWLPNDEI